MSAALTSDVVFDVAFSLPLFLFSLYRVLLQFLSLIISIISFDGFRKMISIAYFGRRGTHLFHISTAFIGFKGVGCNISKYLSILLIIINIYAGFNVFDFLLLDVGSKVSLCTGDSLSSCFVDIVGCEP